MLTREQILARSRERKLHRLEVPEWEGEVYVRVMSAAEQMALSRDVKPEELPVRLLLATIVTEDGERVFRDDDFDALAGEDFPVILRVFSFAAKLNGLSNKELEEAMEHFGVTPGA